MVHRSSDEPIGYEEVKVDEKNRRHTQTTDFVTCKRFRQSILGG